MPSNRGMKTIRLFGTLAFLLLANSNLCLALMEIDFLTPARAKELGMEIRTMPVGSDAVRVELEFPAKGVFQNFSRVDLDFSDKGKSLLSSSLREERPKPGRIMVSFAADRAKLDKLTLRVVTGVPMQMMGYELRVKDFVDLAKLK